VDMENALLPLGDTVVCIGQVAIEIGLEMGKISKVANKSFQTQYLFADDIGVSEPKLKTNQTGIKFSQRAYSWSDGYNAAFGSTFFDSLVLNIENADTPRGISVLYDATGCLGSGLSVALNEFILDMMPGLTIFPFPLLPHHFRGAWSSLHTVMAMQSSLDLCDSIVLRTLDDSEYILDSCGMWQNTVGFSHIYSCIASDLSVGVLNRDALLSLSSPRHRLIDVRSSLWHQTLKRHSPPIRKSGSEDKSTNAGSSATSSLKHMAMNLHSLHNSRYTTTGLAADRQCLWSIPSALAIGFESPTLSKDAPRLPAVLRGATPGIVWPELSHLPAPIPLAPSPSSESSHCAICFPSPYALDSLRVCCADAKAALMAGSHLLSLGRPKEDWELATDCVEEYIRLSAAGTTP
jgi:hypothetical protein